MSGLAGMGVATCWMAAEQRVRVLDFIGRVPLDFPASRITGVGELNRGALSCGVPSNLAGWAELIASHGARSLGDALEPAVTLAQDGFPLLDYTADAIRRTSNEGQARHCSRSGAAPTRRWPAPSCSNWTWPAPLLRFRRRSGLSL